MNYYHLDDAAKMIETVIDQAQKNGPFHEGFLRMALQSVIQKSVNMGYAGMQSDTAHEMHPEGSATFLEFCASGGDHLWIVRRTSIASI